MEGEDPISRSSTLKIYMPTGPITIRRIIMSLRIDHLAPLGALVLLIALASPAFGEDGSTAKASSFGDVSYKVLAPTHLGKEAKPLYQVDAYFRIKDLREIAARDKGAYIVPSETGQEPTKLGGKPKPINQIDSRLRLKELRELGSGGKEGVLIPSKIRA